MVSHIKSFVELARLDKPAGFLLLYWPCAWAIILATLTAAINYYMLAVFLLGSIAMRGSGCVINDMIDRKVDAQVERTKNRPLASGRLNMMDAFSLLFLLVSIGFFVFVQINVVAEFYALCAFGLAIIYPLMKKFFGYPQLFLGIVFSSGALVAWAAVVGDINFPAYLLYIGGIFWTVGYDTIYGHMDKKDDVAAGVKSTALSFGKHNKFIIWMCFVLAYVFITYAACMANGGSPYIYCLPALAHMGYIMSRTNLDEPASCLKAFKDIAFITGILFAAGLYIAKIL